MPKQRPPTSQRATSTGRFGLVSITVIDAHDTSHQSRLEVIAQDRWLVMDPGTRISDRPDAGIDLAFSAALEPDRTPGEVLLRRGTEPLRLWAVIHDLDRLPTCRGPWIETALLNMMREFAHRNIESVMMPCLGCPQGIFDEARFLNLLVTAIRKAPVVHRLRVALSSEGVDRSALCAAVRDLKF